MKKGLTEIVFVLDRSGSMSSLKDDAIGGFNSFVEEQKKLEGEANLTLVLFDHEYTIIHNGTPIHLVEPLTSASYVPRGTTALWDAIGRAMSEVEARISDMHKEDRPEKVMMVVLTDGHENASREFKSSFVKESIKKKREKGDMEVLFIGTDESSVADARDFSYTVNGTVHHAPVYMMGAASSRGMNMAYDCMNATVTAYRVDAGTLSADNITTAINASEDTVTI